MTEFIVTSLKGAEHQHWIQSKLSFRMAMETGNLSLPRLRDIVSNVIQVWAFNVSYLKIGKKDSGDSLVVCIFLVALRFA